MLAYGLAFLLSLLVTYSLTPIVKKLAVKVGAMDKPDARKVHQNSIPRLGGLAIYLGFIVALLYQYNMSFNNGVFGLLIGSTVIVLIGIWDDIAQIPAKVKLVGQILAAAVLVFFDIRIDWITTPSGELVYLNYLSIPLTIFWIVGFTNMVNLIDGLDGLAAGISLIACLTMFFVALQMGQQEVAYLTLALAGAAFGFLQYNFNPAKIFMGDTGSMLLGYVMAAISIIGVMKTATTVALIVPVVALGVPILDTALAIVRRRLQGKPIFQPDKGHLHHRLLDIGLSQKQAVLLMYVISAVLGCLAIIVAGVNAWLGGFIIVVAIFAGVYAAKRLGVISAPKSKYSKDKH